MFFKPNLGMQGNIEEALKRNQKTSNRIFNEENTRAASDMENREALEAALAGADETAISLYEAQEAQETINAQQDDALMEIYEMIG